MQAGDKSEQIKGLYVTQITEDGDLAVLSGSNQFSVSDKVIRCLLYTSANGRKSENDARIQHPKGND